MQLDTDVLIIGAGMSGIGLAVQLIRQFGTRNFELIEKSTQIGGTWFVNSYPGCGCDVPSHFFSYSFALKPDWTQKFAMQPEINQYFRDVAAHYDIDSHVRFRSVVESAHWDDVSGTWLVTIKDLATSEILQRRCKVLVSAVGALSVPKECDVPGAPSFGGRLFHTAQWDHSFDWEDKDVVVIGNGCSATQAVPVMSMGDAPVRKITQFSRQAHWLAERPNPEYSDLFKWTMRWVPFAMRMYRASLYWAQERDFAGFDIVTGADTRRQWEKEAADYIRREAPAKYRDFLVPKTEIGCKRRVNDTDYLACLHQDNVELVYDDPIEEIIEAGVKTRSGRVVPADAIVLAQGFETQKPLAPMNIFGQGNESITDHWDRVSDGAASSYFGTCLSNFPNFFIMMGPNTLSGHLSVIYTTECQINFTMRAIKPVMKALSASRSLLPTLTPNTDIVSVRPEAEQRDINAVQEKAKKLVWASGCTSWFIEAKSNRNTIMFPDYQYKFWWRSAFVPWRDLECRTSRAFAEAGGSSGLGTWTLMAIAVSVAGAGAVHFGDALLR